MNKDQFILALFALLMASCTASAQITITEGSVMSIGSEFSAAGVTSATFEVGPAGVNQTWTFGSYDWEQSSSSVVVDPIGTPYADDFPTATYAIQETESGEDFFTYGRVAANGIFFLGFGGMGEVTIWDEEVLSLVLPCTYQTAWTSVSRLIMEIGPVRVTTTDSSIHTADGWGNVITPYGNYPCLRIFTHTYRTSEITGMPTTEHQNVAYEWLAQDGGEVVILMSPQDVVDPNFTQGQLTMRTSGVAVDPPRGPVADRFAVNQNYPNPFNPMTSLPVELVQSARVNLTIYDELGRRVSQEQFDLNPGHHDLSINGSAWSTGTYFARVSAGNNSQTVKMHLIK